MNNKNIQIQKAKTEDVRGIQEVYYKTWLDTYPNEEIGITTEDITEYWKDGFSAERIKKREQDISNNTDQMLFLVAKDGDMVVGFMKLEKHEDRDELSSFYVLPEYQGKGLGLKLWKKGMDFLVNNRQVFVRVATYNERAISFYKKLGFSDTGKRFTDEKHKMPISGVVIPEMEMIMLLKK